MYRSNASKSASPLAFIISPQPWSGFRVSKHHYAMALAAQGWKVVFIDPPTDLKKAGGIELTETTCPGIAVLRYQTFFPYSLKFRQRTVFDYLMRWQARCITKIIGRPDLLWDFDNAYQFRDLGPFGARTSLFHLVDDTGLHGLGTKNADHIFYLHESFCRNAGGKPRPECHIQHGLSKAYERAAERAIGKPWPADRMHGPNIGFIGNLSASWVDWEAIRTMLSRHPEALFTFWGPLPSSDNKNDALNSILNEANSRFPGLSSPEQIIADSSCVDVWLIPFRCDKLPGGPLNSHKVLEYLSTGKAVVMSWLDAYRDNPLVNMLPSPSSDGLADLLDDILRNLPQINAPHVMESRRAFALKQSYDRLLKQVLSVAGIDFLDIAKRH